MQVCMFTAIMEKEGGSPATNHRLKSYKNKGMDSDELRRRREEEGIQLRKQKREQQVSKVFTPKIVCEILPLRNFKNIITDFVCCIL